MELATTDGNNLKIYFPPCLISIWQHFLVHGPQGSISPFQTHNPPNYISFHNSSALSLHTAKATTGTTLQNTSGFHLWTPLSAPTSHMVKLLLCRLPAPRTCSHCKGFTAPHTASFFKCNKYWHLPSFSHFPLPCKGGCSGCGSKKANQNNFCIVKPAMFKVRCIFKGCVQCKIRWTRVLRLPHSCRTLWKKNQREFLSTLLENTPSTTYFLCECFLITSKQKQSIKIVPLLESWPLTKPLELWDGYMSWEGKKCVYREWAAGKQLFPSKLVQAFSNYTSAQQGKEVHPYRLHEMSTLQHCKGVTIVTEKVTTSHDKGYGDTPMMQKSQLDHKDASATQREQGVSFHSPACLGKSHQHLHPLIPKPRQLHGYFCHVFLNHGLKQKSCALSYWIWRYAKTDRAMDTPEAAKGEKSEGYHHFIFLI